MKGFCSLLILLSAFLVGGVQAQGYHDFFDPHHGRKSKKLDYDSLFAAATPLEKSEEGRKLMEACLDAYGGEAHLKKLKSFQLIFDMNAFMQSEPIMVEKLYAQGRKYKIVRHQQPQPEIRILNADKSWFIGRDTVIEYYSGKYKAELFSYLTLSMPLAMKTEPFSEIRFGWRDDDSLGYVYMKKVDSLMIVIGIDPKDLMIKKSEGIIYQDSSSFVYVNKFSDFKTVEGYIFPHRLTNISLGLEVAQSQLEVVKINPNFGDNIFKPQSKIDLKKVY
jgi:hypothetical protein